MSRSSSRRTAEHRSRTKLWLQNALAGLAVSALGLGVVGSVMATGHAQHRTTDQPNVTVQESTEPSVDQPSAFDRRDEKDDTSRDSSRPALKGQVHEQAEQRSEALAKTSGKASQQAQKAAESKRAKTLRANQQAAEENGERLAAAAKKAEQQKQQNAASNDQSGQDQSSGADQSGQDQSTGGTDQTGSDQSGADQSGAEQAPAGGSGTGKATLPLANYSVAARFGQVGSWSRYHTGFDFSAPVGTPIRAADSGTVTNAGSGSASGWAGTYVTIKHADGTSSLYAHMSSVAVSVGQQVSGGAQIGHVGMTGRSFGPHCHFEIYPAGVTPGDVYRAVNPETWLQARGLNP